MYYAHVMFATSIILFALSLLLSLLEILKSTRALELELSDMEGLDDDNLVDYLRKNSTNKCSIRAINEPLFYSDCVVSSVIFAV